jgi:broad specificity phosphatase PhoE
MKPDEKILILIRHAHRDTTRIELDNGLSGEGVSQAKTLANSLKGIFRLKNAVLLSSPKRRCIETLEPIRLLGNLKIETDPLLVEKQEIETFSHFKKRIEQFIESWQSQQNALTLICSHGDWLPEAVEILVGAKSEFKKGSWAELFISNNRPSIRFRNL